MVLQDVKGENTPQSLLWIQQAQPKEIHRVFGEARLKSIARIGIFCGLGGCALFYFVYMQPISLSSGSGYVCVSFYFISFFIWFPGDPLAGSGVAMRLFESQELSFLGVFKQVLTNPFWVSPRPQARKPTHWKSVNVQLNIFCRVNGAFWLL